MNNLIVISQVLYVAGRKTTFDFRGFYRGKKIEKIILSYEKSELVISETYLLYLKDVNIISNTLYGNIERLKKLTEVMF